MTFAYGFSSPTVCNAFLLGLIVCARNLSNKIHSATRCAREPSALTVGSRGLTFNAIAPGLHSSMLLEEHWKILGHVRRPYGTPGE